MNKKDFDTNFLGVKQITCTLPCGNICTIREQTAEDEGILSTKKSILDQTALDRFLQAIIVDLSCANAGKGGKPLEISDVSKLKVHSRVALLLLSRCLSLGPVINFNYHWADMPDPTMYEEDLSEFLEIQENNTVKFNSIFDYPHGIEDVEFVTSTDKHLKFKISDGYSENYMVSQGENKNNIDEYISRDLSMKVQDSWVKVTNFALFSSRESAEIRRIIHQYDEDFDLTIKIAHPNIPNAELDFPILSANDFFFPGM